MSFSNQGALESYWTGSKKTFATRQHNIKKGKDISLLLWNTEGLKNAFSLMTENILRHDIAISTETFLAEQIYMDRYYSIHNLAQ